MSLGSSEEKKGGGGGWRIHGFILGIDANHTTGFVTSSTSVELVTAVRVYVAGLSNLRREGNFIGPRRCAREQLQMFNVALLPRWQVSRQTVMDRANSRVPWTLTVISLEMQPSLPSKDPMHRELDSDPPTPPFSLRLTRRRAKKKKSWHRVVSSAGKRIAKETDRRETRCIWRSCVLAQSARSPPV